MRHSDVAVVALAACGGCNQAFDLRETSPPPVDAAPYCPADASAPPFSYRLVQVAASECTNYSFSESASRGLAQCYSNGLFTVREGPLDGELEPTTVTLPAAISSIFTPVLSADGNETWVRASTLTEPTLGVLDRVGDHTWAWRDVVPGPAEGHTLDVTPVGLVEGRSGRRLLVQLGLRFTPDAELVERADDGSRTWPTVTQRITAGSLGLTELDRIAISADGRRLTITSDAKVFYAMRDDVDQPFSTAVALPTIPYDSQGAYPMTTDCARIYLYAIGSIFYATQ